MEILVTVSILSFWSSSTVNKVRKVYTTKFWTEIFRGYVLQGVEFPIFLLILAWALQRCSVNALPVIAGLVNVREILAQR